MFGQKATHPVELADIGGNDDQAASQSGTRYQYVVGANRLALRLQGGTNRSDGLSIRFFKWHSSNH